jgi:hypothetical protein
MRDRVEIRGHPPSFRRRNYGAAREGRNRVESRESKSRCLSPSAPRKNTPRGRTAALSGSAATTTRRPKASSSQQAVRNSSLRTWRLGERNSSLARAQRRQEECRIDTRRLLHRPRLVSATGGNPTSPSSPCLCEKSSSVPSLPAFQIHPIGRPLPTLGKIAADLSKHWKSRRWPVTPRRPSILDAAFAADPETEDSAFEGLSPGDGQAARTEGIPSQVLPSRRRASFFE